MRNDKVQTCWGCSTHEHILQSGELPVKEGYIGNYYDIVLRGTGCTAALVRESMNINTQMKRGCMLADGTTNQYKVADITVDTPYYKVN